MMLLRELTYSSMLLRLVLAVVVGGILGMEREMKHRPAGLRTYMLVCLGAAVVMMTNQYVLQCIGSGDPTRMGAQVVSGIGFLGGGSILVTRRNKVQGITTAAGIWATACVGLAIGIGFFEIGLMCAGIMLLIFTVVNRVDDYSRKKDRIPELFLELESRDTVIPFMAYLRENRLAISNLGQESETFTFGNRFAFSARIKSLDKKSREEILETVSKAPGLVYYQEFR